MAKLKMATLWFAGCAGCHMSLLDIDEDIIPLLEKVDILYSPVVDTKIKDFPEVDITLIEGAVTTEEQMEILKMVRKKTKLLIAFGDCAVWGNIPALRNPSNQNREKALDIAYRQNVDINPKIPGEVPRFLDRAYSLNEIVKIDGAIPGCPPPASTIKYILTELLEGREPQLEGVVRFG